MAGANFALAEADRIIILVSWPDLPEGRVPRGPESFGPIQGLGDLGFPICSHLSIGKALLSVFHLRRNGNG